MRPPPRGAGWHTRDGTLHARDPGVAKLDQHPARPRTFARTPLYPRAFGVGAALLLSACGGSVERDAQAGDQLGDQPGETAATGGTGGTGAGTKPATGGSPGSGGVGGDPWGGGNAGGAGAPSWDEDAGFGGTSAEPDPGLDAADPSLDDGGTDEGGAQVH